MADAGRYDRDASLPSLLEHWSRRTPAACAVRDGRTELSYGVLTRRANALAHRLVAAGVGLGEPVGLVAHRGVDAVVALVGILKAGGAYVPLDTAYPPARLAVMAEEVKLSHAVQVAGAHHDLRLTTLVVDERESAEPPALPRPLTGADLAYVMFTSGSTGRPKAVGVPHRAVSRLVVDTDYVSFSRHDTVLQHSVLSFDGSTFELWGALLNGARMVVTDPHLVFSPDQLRRVLREESVTIGFVTTAVFHQLATEAPDVFGGLHTLLVGGEALAVEPTRLVLASGPPRRLVNVYGPTENTGFTTAHPIESALGDVIPIGIPIARTTCHLQRPDGSRADVGERGELVVGGDGLAVGYLNDAALTAQKFVPDPLGTGRLYRTGDMCSMRAGGTLEFHGRLDSQVKLHGHRIELTEVEAALRAHPMVADVVVTRQQTADDAQLVGHVVTAAGQWPLMAAELRDFLGERLPGYSVPAVYRHINRVPLTPQGKVDRSALTVTSAAVEPQTTPVGGSLLTQVRSVWLAALAHRGLAPDIDPEQTLFDVGGTSFEALAVHAEMTSRFDVPDLTPLDIFAYPTLADYTEHLAGLLPGAHAL